MTSSKAHGNLYDTYVKDVFSRLFMFVDFLINYADPKFVAEIDLEHIKAVPTHYVGPKGDERIIDLVFKCPRKNGKGSRLVVMIFEHQSGSLRDIPLKLLKYICAIWVAEAKDKKPLSIPYFIVLRTGKKPHRGPLPQISDQFPKRADGEQIGKTITIEYDLVDLPAWDIKKLVGRPELRLTLGILKKMTEGTELEFPEALLPIGELPDGEYKIELTTETIVFIDKVFQARSRVLEPEMLQDAMEPIFQNQKRSKNMVISLLEGKFLEGEVKWKIETILLILADRFDGVSKRLEKKIKKITDVEKLNELAKLSAKCESKKEFENALDS